MKQHDKINSISQKHPLGLWYLSTSYALFIVSYAILLSLATMYFRHLNLGSTESYSLFAAFVALVWMNTLLGGYLSGQFGYKQVGLIGLIFAAIGMIFLCFKGIHYVYLGLATYAAGYGLCTTAVFSSIGLLYKRNDARRDSGFTFFYLIFNLGAAIAIIAGGFIAQSFGYRFTFMLATLFLIIGILIYVFSSNAIRFDPDYGFSEQLTRWHLPNAIKICVAAVISAVLCFFLLEHVKINNALIWILSIASVLGVLLMAGKQQQKKAKLKLVAFVILVIISLTYWALYNLEPSLLTVYISKVVDKSFLGIQLPASTFFSLDPMFVVILGLFFTWLWRYLANKNIDIALPMKFSAALLLVGFGFWVFMFGIHMSPTNALVNPWWIVLGYIFLTTGELMIGPIAMSMVGRLSPPGKDGILMGVYTLLTGLAGIISGYLANMAVIPKEEGLIAAKAIYAQTFFEVGLIVIISGLIALCLVPLIKRLIRK